MEFDRFADQLMNRTVLFVANNQTNKQKENKMDEEEEEIVKEGDEMDLESKTPKREDAPDEGPVVAYRLAEIEFYFSSPDHDDVFTHKEEMQRNSGKWCVPPIPSLHASAHLIFIVIFIFIRYFHRDVSDRNKYRSGNRKGLDITFGNGERKVRPFMTFVGWSQPADSLLSNSPTSTEAS